MGDRFLKASDGGHGEDEVGDMKVSLTADDEGQGEDRVSDLDRFWDSLRVSLFSIILGSSFTVGISLGLKFTWWVGLLGFNLSFIAVYFLLRCKKPRNYVIRLMDPLVNPPKRRKN